MSFSINVKNELLDILSSRHCAIAEFYAFTLYNLKIKDNVYIFSLENSILLKKCKALIKYIFDYDIDIISNKNKYFEIRINKDYIIDYINKLYKDALLITSSSCCKRAFIRGAFICNGYISSPEKNYHLEFINPSLEKANFLKEMLNFFEIDAKIIEKKDNYMLYLKDAEQIVDLLNVIEAHKALLELENIRILKEVRNNVNRIVNCETANLNKIILSGLKQKEDILIIKDKLGLDNLPIQLKDVALIRLNNPDLSLKEIGEMLEPPISKSGVNHRLKKLSAIAQKLKD